MSKNLKKLTVILTILLLVPIISLYEGSVSANSGPPYISPEGGLGGFSFEHSDIIKVLGEDLYFDLNDNRNEQYRARVTAKYTMQNLSSNAEKIKMAFPFYDPSFLSGGEEGFAEPISITAGGEAVPYSLRLLGTNIKWDDVGGGITREFIDGMLESLSEGKTLLIDEEKNYTTFEVAPSSAETLIGISEMDGFIYISADVGSYSYFNENKNNIKIAEVRAGSQNFVVVTESGQNLENNLMGGSIVKTTEIENIKEFMLDEIQRYFGTLTGNSDNAVARDRRLAEDVYNFVFSKVSNGYYDEENFRYVFSYSVMGIFYEVDFAANQTLDVTVSYGANPFSPSVNGSYPDDYIYFLSPAQYWKDFGNLNITVDVSDTAYKYMLDSSADFTYDNKEEKYVYESETLPQGELTFRMYREKRLPLLHPYAWIFIGVIAGICAVLAVLIAVPIIIVTQVKKKRDKDKYKV